MKDLKVWNEDLQKTRNELLCWAYSIEGTWKANLIFLSVFLVMGLLCQLFGLKWIARGIYLIMAFQIIIIIWKRLKI